MKNDKETIEAVASAWASMDGKLQDFLDSRDYPDTNMDLGTYDGYMEDAKELIARIEKRGYSIGS